MCDDERIIQLVLCTLLVMVLITLGAFCITIMESLPDESILRKRSYGLALLYIFSGFITYSVSFVSGNPYVNSIIVSIGAFVILVFGEIFEITTANKENSKDKVK